MFMAQPTTLTGSIGIFGALPDFSELMTKKLGFKYDEVKTNRNSGYTGAEAPVHWTADEISQHASLREPWLCPLPPACR